MISGPEVYQAYRAVQLHFDPTVAYDIRKNKGRVSGSFKSPRAQNPLFHVLGKKLKNVGEAIAIFTHVQVQYSEDLWAPDVALRLLSIDPNLPETLRANWTNIGGIIHQDILDFSDGLSSNLISIKDWIGLNPFDLRSSVLNDFHLRPEFIISVIEALDIWQQLMVQCNIKFRQSLYILDRYKSFLGDSLVQKGVQMVQCHIDVQRQKRILLETNADQGKSHTAKEEEINEWQALFQN